MVCSHAGTASAGCLTFPIREGVAEGTGGTVEGPIRRDDYKYLYVLNLSVVFVGHRSGHVTGNILGSFLLISRVSFLTPYMASL